MTGVDSNATLKFYLKKENSYNRIDLWKTTGDSGPFWYSHRLTVNSTLKWQFGFEVVTYHTGTALIAIDDVIVELNKQCPPKGRCDFEASIHLF